MDTVEILGLLAGALTTVSFLPQVVKTWKTRSAKDLSLGMFLIFWMGVILWLTYGILIEDTPIIVANALTLTLASVILYFKFTFKE